MITHTPGGWISGSGGPRNERSVDQNEGDERRVFRHSHRSGHNTV